jgi:hypothetical protein
MKILLGDFNAKVGREDLFKPKIWNGRLHEISNYNGVTVINFVTSRDLTIISTMFTLNKYAWTFPDRKTHDHIDHILLDMRRHLGVLDVRSLRAADCDTNHYLVVAKFGEQ